MRKPGTSLVLLAALCIPAAAGPTKIADAGFANVAIGHAGIVTSEKGSDLQVADGGSITPGLIIGLAIVARVVERLKRFGDFAAACALIAGSDVSERRGAVQAARQFDDHTFFARFGDFQ